MIGYLLLYIDYFAPVFRFVKAGVFYYSFVF